MTADRLRRRALLTVMFSLGVAACSSSSSPPPSTPPPTIRLARNPWDASRLDAEIVRILLTEEMGYTVEVSDIDETAQFDAIAAGSLHASLEVWPSGHGQEIAKYVVTGRVEDGGPLGPLGKIGWYVPSYLLTSYPQLGTWRGFLDPAMVELFRSVETGTQGRFLSGDMSWTHYDEQIIKNLKLDFAVVYAGSELAELAELDRAYQKHEPILFYMWVPHWVHARYDLTSVQLPEYSDACYAKKDAGGIDCDYPVDHLFKIFWPRLRTYAPAAYRLLQSFSYSTRDQIELLGKIDADHKTIEQTARGWIAANSAIWKTWITK